MKRDRPASDSPEADAETARENALAALREAREYAEYKAYGDGRLRDMDREKVRIKYLNLIVSSADAERRMLKDKDLDALAEQVEKLEERSERAKYR